MRRRPFLVAAGATAISGCTALLGDDEKTAPESCDLDPSRDRGTSDWPSVRGDGRNSGAVPSEALPSPPLSVGWTFQMDGMVGTVQPAVAGDAVLATDYDSTAYAVDAATGAERWRVGMADVHFDPTVADDLALFVSDAGLRAYDRSTGEHAWTAPQPDGPESFDGPPTSDGDVVCLGTDLGVVGLDAATGEHRWNRRTGLRTDVPPAVVDGTAYGGSRDTYVYALDAESGAVEWRFKTRGRIECAPAVVDGTVFVGSNDGFAYALDAERGEERWRHEVGSPVTALAVTGGRVFVGSEDRLVALRASTGESCWESGEYAGWGLAAGIEHLYAPITGDFRTDAEETVGAFDPATGALDWYLDGREGRFYNGPAVADGALYVGGVTRDGVAVAKLVEE